MCGALQAVERRSSGKGGREKERHKIHTDCVYLLYCTGTVRVDKKPKDGEPLSTRWTDRLWHGYVIL
jgi:hypothetical protein